MDSKDVKDVDHRVSVDVRGSPITNLDNHQEHHDVLDTEYLASRGLSKFYHSVLFQMILFGALSFVGPAMSDAISNLGGGGLSTPFLSNLANSVDYASGCLISLFGGPLINKLGIKWACVIASIGMPLGPSGYYQSARFGTDWYLLLAKACYTPTSFAMDGTCVLIETLRSLEALPADFCGIAWGTYLIFVAFACTGIIWALLLSPTRLVRRRDGSRVPTSSTTSWAGELKALARHLRAPKTWLVFIPAFYSFFYGGTMGTYLSLHFSVRARALSTLITPSITVPMVIAFGRLLDTKHWSQKTRAWISFAFWVIPQAACFIWIGLEYKSFGASDVSLDYILQPRRWAAAYFPYLIVFTTGYLTQLSLYWILGTFSVDTKSNARTGGLFRAFETAGQAVSYGINSSSGGDVRIGFFVNCALLVVSVPCMWFLIGLVPDRPSEIDLDEVDEVDSRVLVGVGSR
ncbi:hypothetical protein EG327_006139 [Venturia inaequalis]|uniref:MFS general substrate transporter n=1 Tax=Venturia inaequalis TaxID=5025 RepID=A0A8H3V426_VENIN|nr:hypothetical protein EG327_006139 [Venturia inaequalis]